MATLHHHLRNTRPCRGRWTLTLRQPSLPAVSHCCLLLLVAITVGKCISHNRYARTVAEIVPPLQASLFMKGSGTRQEHLGIPRTDRSTLNLSFIFGCARLLTTCSVSEVVRSHHRSSNTFRAQPSYTLEPLCHQEGRGTSCTYPTTLVVTSTTLDIKLGVLWGIPYRLLATSQRPLPQQPHFRLHPEH